MQIATYWRVTFFFLATTSNVVFDPVSSIAAPPDQSESPRPADVAAQPGGAVPTPLVIPDERRFWLGLRIAPASTALRSQLKLGDAGLIVLDVIAGSPAHTAGLAQDDLLLDAVAGGTTTALRQVSDLSWVVLAAVRGRDAAQIKFLRNGEPQTRDVAPALRPLPVYGASRHHSRVIGSLDDDVFFETWPMSVMMRPQRLTVAEPLPDNVSVTVTRNGSQPAKITVRRDLEEWTVTEQEIHKLPNDIRPYVTRMLTSPVVPAPVRQLPQAPLR